MVELLTALTFLAAWLVIGPHSAVLALVYCLVLSGFIVATFIDFEHFIIPDEITIGGTVAGFFISFLVPRLHGEISPVGSMKQSFLGALAGAGIIYLVLRGGKLLFGRQKLELPAQTKIVFGELAVVLPDKQIPYEELFYRDSDTIAMQARIVELADRCYKNVRVRLSPKLLQIDDEKLNPEEIPHLEAITEQIVLPREAMGLGDVKFMAAIGAFLGWPAVIFSLIVSSLIGSLVGLTFVLLRKRALSSRLPYGPYIAMAATLWIFAGPALVAWYQRLLGV
jgi:leader peptidase (prepilin peptidase)/N-methyltransferase